MGSSDWLNKLNGLGEKPTYTSKYQGIIDNLMNTISGRKEFSYDFNKDPMYQQYKDNYTKLGNEASMNAVANASNMTGGYGNSYAVTAAAQANQQYLSQLNNMIPQLAQAAMDKYQMETENLYKKYGMYGDAEDRAYGQYRDSVSDYYTNRDYYTNGYFNDRNFEYQKDRDAIADQQWQQSFDYNAARDAVSDAQWQKNFDNANSQWQKTFDESKRQYDQNYERSKNAARSASGGSGGASNSSSASKNGASSADMNKFIANAKSLTHTAATATNPAKMYAESLYNKGKVSADQYKKILTAIN